MNAEEGRTGFIVYLLVISFVYLPFSTEVERGGTSVPERGQFRSWQNPRPFSLTSPRCISTISRLSTEKRLRSDLPPAFADKQM
jgi:hypothetical protein